MEDRIKEKLQKIEDALSKVDKSADLDDLWPKDILQWDNAFSEDEILEIESELNIKLPKDFVEFITANGPFGFAPKDKTFESSKRRFMTSKEIIEKTKFWRKEINFEDYGFDEHTAKTLDKVLQTGFFFQFVKTSNYSNFYLLSENEVRYWDDDDLSTLNQTIANSFTDHMNNLIEDITRLVNNKKPE